MGTKFKNKIVLKFMKLLLSGKTKEDYLSGYNIQLNDTSFSELINNVEMKGEYKSKNYKRTCEAKFTSKVSLIHYSDGSTKEDDLILNDKIWELKLARNVQKKAINKLKSMGMTIGQKYDFKSIYELAKLNWITKRT